MKVLKKLTLKKEVIANLSNNEMSQQKGGGITGIAYLCPINSQNPWSCSPTINSSTSSTCGCTCGTAYTCNG